jgi:hypothetical protein
MRISRLLIAATFVLAGCDVQIQPASQSPAGARSPSPTQRIDQGGNVLPAPVDAATWARLAAHPLNLTSFGPGLTCPKSSTAQVSPYTGPLAGPGPVYAAGNTAFYTRADDGTLRAKVAWIARPEYTGPALIRGKRLDAAGDVRFAPGGAPIASELRFEYDTGIRAAGSNEGWRFLPSTVVIATTGCYGFQIDGLDWTVTIVMDTTANP